MALYSCEWYNESKEFKDLIRMMILRTNRIFTLKISWFTTMSLPTLMSVRIMRNTLYKNVLKLLFSDGKNQWILLFAIKKYGRVKMLLNIYNLKEIYKHMKF